MSEASSGWGRPWSIGMPWSVGLTHTDPPPLPTTSGDLSQPGPYKIIIADLTCQPIAELSGKNLVASWVLNAPGAVSFTLDLYDPKATTELLKPVERTILIYRYEELIWGGYLWTIDADTQVRVGGEGFLSRFKSRYISDDMSFTDEEQLNIPKALLEYTQAKPYGDLGITYADYDPSGVERTIEYVGTEFTVIGDAITSLSELDVGFDFEIDENRVFHTYFTRKGTNTNIVFQSDKNITGVAWSLDGSQVANEIGAVGSGAEDGTVTHITSDTDSMNTKGRLERSMAHVFDSNSALLNAHASEDLNLAKNIRDQPQLAVTSDDPPFGGYHTGDTVRVIVDQGYIQIDASYRITSIVVSVDDAGRDNTTLFFDTSTVVPNA